MIIIDKLNIVEFSTFYKIPKIKGKHYEPILNLVSVPNFYTQEWVPYGYFEYPTHYRVCKLPETMLYRAIEKCGFDDYDIIKSENFPFKKLTGYKMVNPPKDDLQAEVIRKVLKTFETEERCIVSLQTGQGKTYVATHILSKLKVKALVLVKSNELKKQWINSFSTHTDLKYKDIYSIDSGDDWYPLRDNPQVDPVVIISTHKSVSMFIDKIGIAEFSKFLIQNGIGMKICDEFDLENKSMFLLDTTGSLRYNLYLSATTYKSSKDDDKIFQRIFKEVEDIGKEFHVTVKRNGLFVIYSSNPSEKVYNSLLKWTPKGMVLDYQKYHSYIVEHRSYREPLKQIWEKIIKKRYYSEENLKTVIFMGRRGELAEQFRKDVAELFGLSEDKVAILNSDIPKAKRERIMKESKLIISTSKSLGRGIDLKGLDIIVDLETRASESETTQVIGRVSRSGMKNVGTYISFVDYSISTVKENYLGKVTNGFFKEHLTDIQEMSIGHVKNDPVKLTEGNRLIITGNRNFDDYQLVKDEVTRYINDLGNAVEIVSGKAKGVDALGEKLAKELGLNIAEFPADWEKFGKRAGYLRNTEMGKYATHAIIFCNSEDKGSTMMLNIMKYFKKPYRHINI